MSAWLWGSRAVGSILKGGSDQGQAGMRLQSWGQFLRFLLKPVLNWSNRHLLHEPGSRYLLQSKNIILIHKIIIYKIKRTQEVPSLGPIPSFIVF